jgi:hypothetical protein
VNSTVNNNNNNNKPVSNEAQLTNKSEAIKKTEDKKPSTPAPISTSTSTPVGPADNIKQEPEQTKPLTKPIATSSFTPEPTVSVTSAPVMPIAVDVAAVTPPTLVVPCADSKSNLIRFEKLINIFLIFYHLYY